MIGGRVLATLAFLALGAGVASGAGCIVMSSDSFDAAATPTCESAETASAADMQRFFESAKTDLHTRGIEFDGTIWTDPAKFDAYLKAFAAAAGCADISRAPQGARHPLAVTLPFHNYCGPGFDKRCPKVSSCLNELCRVHDSCYARCSGPTNLLCVWNAATSPCDDAMLTKAEACPPEPGTRFASGAILLLANSLASLGRGTPVLSLGCSDGLRCPAENERGVGPCETDPSAAACAACLDVTDPGRACDELQCGGQTDPVCYTATCKVGQCYGGWGDAGAPVGDTETPEAAAAPEAEPDSASDAGIPEAAAPPDAEPDSASDAGTEGATAPAAWSVRILNAQLPALNLSIDWDADLSAPDPFVILAIGATQACYSTPAIQDTYTPTWNAGPSFTFSTADLMSYFHVEVWDEDIAIHDLVGACDMPLTAANFSGAPVTIDCQQTATQAGFVLRLALVAQ